MLCENCGKNEANIVFSKYVNGEKTVKHLCQSCMAEEEKDFAFSFLGGLPQNFGNVFSDAQGTQPPEVQCEKCGMTWNAFQKRAEVGCTQCYQAFRPQLTPILKRVHGNAKHAGKVPRTASEEAKQLNLVEELRTKLGKAVVEEEYEKAAQIRDEIRQLEEVGGETDVGKR